jgi:hypothetical protein
MMFRSDFDNIGFNPTQNQSEFGTPRFSGYGVSANATAPMAATDYFPSWPYKGQIDYTGAQGFGGPFNESIYGRTFLYRGIVPITLLPIINTPYPYQFGAKRLRNTSL